MRNMDKRCERAKSAYFRSARSDSDNKLFFVERLGTRLPHDTLTSLYSLNCISLDSDNTRLHSYFVVFSELYIYHLALRNMS